MIGANVIVINAARRHEGKSPLDGVADVFVVVLMAIIVFGIAGYALSRVIKMLTNGLINAIAYMTRHE